MSNISNRFYVTALEDGTTLHGNLVSDKPLTQAWNGTSAIPDWTVAANQPTVYLTLFSGASLVQPQSGFKWYYNGVEIQDSDTRFQKTTKSVTYGSQTVTMPALKIIANLANSNNVDMDMISFEGSYVIDGSGIEFSCSAQVRISEITKGSMFGVIEFVGGISDITEVGQVITMYGKLYDAEGTVVTDNTKWYLNEQTTGTTGTTVTVGGTTYTNAFQVSEGGIVDHGSIRCEFYDANNSLKFTAYADIDDMQDPEFMYIQYNGANGNAASLRKDETASFQIWVGKRDDPSVLGGTTNPTYSVFKVKLLDGDGAVITASGLATNIPDADANGFRTLTVSGGKASITPHYDTVNGVGKKNLTGIVIAYTS